MSNSEGRPPGPSRVLACLQVSAPVHAATVAEMPTLVGPWLISAAAAKANSLLGRAPLLASRVTAGYAHQVSAAEAMDVAIYAPLTGMRTGAARGAAAVD